MEREPATAEDQPTRRPFQFSLRSLLILMTVTAVFLSALFGGNDWIAAATVYVLFTAWPMVLTIVLIYGRGKTRTFCIGALFPVAPLPASPSSLFFAVAFGRIPAPPFGLEVRLQLGLACLVMLVASVLVGVAALGVRRLVESSARREKAPAPAENPTSETARST